MMKYVLSGSKYYRVWYVWLAVKLIEWNGINIQVMHTGPMSIIPVLHGVPVYKSYCLLYMTCHGCHNHVLSSEVSHLWHQIGLEWLLEGPPQGVPQGCGQHRMLLWKIWCHIAPCDTLKPPETALAWDNVSVNPIRFRFLISYQVHRYIYRRLLVGVDDPGWHLRLVSRHDYL